MINFLCNTIARRFMSGVLTFTRSPKMAPKRPDVVKKQQRVKKILDEPEVQEKMQKKVAKKRDLKAIKKIEKAGGDDSRPITKPKRAKKEVVSFVASVPKSKHVSDKSAKPKSVRSGNARKSNKDASTSVGSS